MDKLVELKPCPFCGGEPEEYSVADSEDASWEDMRRVVICDQCDIELPLEKWDTRAPDALASQAVREQALEEAVGYAFRDSPNNAWTLCQSDTRPREHPGREIREVAIRALKPTRQREDGHV